MRKLDLSPCNVLHVIVLHVFAVLYVHMLTIQVWKEDIVNCMKLASHDACILIQADLDEATDRWGVDVQKVEM